MEINMRKGAGCRHAHQLPTVQRDGRRGNGVLYEIDEEDAAYLSRMKIPMIALNRDANVNLLRPYAIRAFAGRILKMFAG